MCAGGLEDQPASIVATDGTVTDGPRPDAIGGLTVVDVPSREEALDWAAKIAVACRCAQEVRAIGLRHPGRRRTRAARAPPVIVLTGATNGLGLLAALELARKGARLALVVRNQAKAGALRTEIEQAAPGAEVDFFPADLSLLPKFPGQADRSTPATRGSTR